MPFLTLAVTLLLLLVLMMGAVGIAYIDHLAKRIERLERRLSPPVRTQKRRFRDDVEYSR